MASPSLRNSFKHLKLSKLEKPPAHMRTGQQIAQAEDMATSTVSRMVKALIASGEWVRKPYPVSDDSGIMRAIPHYGPKKP